MIDLSEPVEIRGIFQRRIDETKFPRLIALAKKLGKPFASFDLETSTFRGAATFGITEICVIRLQPGSPGIMWYGLVNPENPIAAKVVEVTGITQAMVSGKPTFARWIPTFKRVAANGIALGYNSSTFDIPSLKDQAIRYGATLDFGNDIDVYRSYLRLVRGTGNGTKGKLGDIAAKFGITLDGRLHRAPADALLTALLAEAILEHYGTHGLTGHSPLGELKSTTKTTNSRKPQDAQGIPAAKPAADTSTVIEEAIRANGYHKHHIAKTLSLSQTDD